MNPIRNRSPDRNQRSGYLLQPDHSDAIDVFDRIALSELRRAAHLRPILRPASRDQIRDRAVRQRSSDVPSEIFFRSRFVRTFGPRSAGAPNDWRRPCGLPMLDQQLNTQSDKLPSSPGPSFVSGRLDHQRHHKDRLRTRVTPHLEASRSIFSSRFLQNRHETQSASCKLLLLQRISPVSTPDV